MHANFLYNLLNVFYTFKIVPKKALFRKQNGGSHGLGRGGDGGVSDCVLDGMWVPFWIGGVVGSGFSWKPYLQL